MPKFVTLFKLSKDAIAALIERPSDRVAALRKVAEAAGGRVESYYWMFGEYDGLAIFEMPDSKAMAAFALAVASTGAVELETNELVDPADLGAILKHAKEMRAKYQVPGS